MLFRKFKFWGAIGIIGAFIFGLQGSFWSLSFPIICMIIGGLLDPETSDSTYSSDYMSSPRKRNKKEEFEEYQFYKIVNKK